MLFTSILAILSLAIVTTSVSPPPLRCTTFLQGSYPHPVRWVEEYTVWSKLKEYCDIVEQEAKPDQNDEQWIQRDYFDEPNQIQFGTLIPARSSGIDSATCIEAIVRIMIECRVKTDYRPLHDGKAVVWTRGGLNSLGDLNSSSIPTFFLNPPMIRKYAHGKCSLQLTQWKFRMKKNSEKYNHYIRGELFDGNGRIDETRRASGMPDPFPFMRSDDGKPAVVNLFYEPLEITAEARGNYVQFTMGGQSWRSTDQPKGPGKTGCDVVPYKDARYPDEYLPGTVKKTTWERNMTCWFDC